MESLMDEVAGDVQSHPSEPKIPQVIFERILPILGDPTTRPQVGEAFLHLTVVTNFEGHVKYATTRKVGNIRFNLKDAVLDESLDLVETVAAVVAGSVIKLLMPIACLQVLRYLRDLSTIELTETDAVILKRLFELGGEDRTVALSDLAKSPDVAQGAVDAAIPKLQKLGCISTIGDEIVLNETIDFQQDT